MVIPKTNGPLPSSYIGTSGEPAGGVNSVSEGVANSVLTGLDGIGVVGVALTAGVGIGCKSGGGA